MRPRLPAGIIHRLRSARIPGVQPPPATPEPDPGAGLIPLAEPVRATASRKDDHLRIAAGDRVAHARTTGLERHRLVHRALPGRNLRDVDLTTDLLGARLAAPLLVSAMTGGTPRAATVNARLARAAAEHGIGMVLGSGRALLRDPGLLPTYRSVDRPPLLLANIGAAQLLEPSGLDDARRLVELTGADGLTLHLNPLQEAIQPEGQTEFTGLSERIAALCATMAPVPVVVKEVGFGIGPADARELREAGVAAVDVAGAGGTNWALVEGERDPAAAALASAFGGWGIATADALTGTAEALGGAVPVIASGGLADGVEAVTCLALGASAASFARHLLLAAQADDAEAAVGALVEQVRIATWLTGAASSAELGPQHLQGGAA